MSTPTDPQPALAQPSTAVSRSRIAGYGTFAGEPIRAGVVVLRYPAAPASVEALGPVNHSCEPTLGWVDDRTLVAMRDVRPGEELTTDYALCIGEPAFMMMCHCETYRCRQVIEGDDWQIPQLRRRYAGFWTPTLARRIAAEPR